MEKETKKEKKGSKMKFIIGGIVVAVVIGIGIFLMGGNTESTDNAQLDANIVPVRPNPVCISSSTSKAPISVQRCLSAFIHPIEGVITPRSACTGSAITQAVCSSIASRDVNSLW